MKMKTKNLGFILISILAVTMQILSCSLPGSSESADNLDDSMLFMISANAHMLENPEAYPDALSAAKLASLSTEPTMQTRSQVNEQRILANYYLRFSSNLDESNPRYSYFLAKAHAHSQMAEVLQRRRNRNHTVIQKMGRAIVRPFKFIAKELTKLIKEGMKLIGEVGPEIIREMVKSYITTGQPLNAKVFFNKLKKAGVFRIKQALAKKLNIPLPEDLQTAEEPQPEPAEPASGEPSSEGPASEESGSNEPAPWDAESEEETGDEGEGGYDDPNEPDSYGTITVELDIETVFGGFDFEDFWDPQLPGNVNCAYSSYQVWVEEMTFPLVFDLDQETLKADFAGYAHESSPPISELSVPTWDNSADFDGVIKDGWVVPKSDLTGWDFGGKIEVTVDPEGKTRCIESGPGYANNIWITASVATMTLTSELTGEIVQGEIVDGKLVTSPGGKMEVSIQEIGNPDNSFFLYAEGDLASGAFPVPFHTPEATD